MTRAVTMDRSTELSRFQYSYAMFVLTPSEQPDTEIFRIKQNLQFLIIVTLEMHKRKTWTVLDCVNG